MATQPEFWEVPDPSGEALARVARLDACNPFYAPAYVAARRALGVQPWALGLREGDSVLLACTAFAQAGRLNRCLSIESVPAVDDNTFWRGLVDFCGRLRFSLLEINSFASRSGEIAALPGEISRRKRCEFILDLSNSGYDDRIGSQHRRSIRRAERAGLEVRRAKDRAACEAHRRLIELSMGRRRQRGESVPSGDSLQPYLSLTEAGAAEIFQVMQGPEALSSILVLKAERGAYYHSAGTSPEGMKSGASPFLIREVARTLRHEGLSAFNLGGADEGTGLERFKAGFGGERRTLSAAKFFCGRMWQRRITTLIDIARRSWARVGAGAN